MNDFPQRAVHNLRYQFGILSMALGLAMLALSCAQPASPQPTVAPPGAQSAPPALPQPSPQTRLAQSSPTSALQPPAIQGAAAPLPALAAPAASAAPSWPLGTATPSEECALCHMAIYREYAFGFGADLQYKGMIAAAPSAQEQLLELPPDHPSTGTAHAYAGVDPWPIRARQLEEGGKSCNVCHYPQAFDLPAFDVVSVPKPPARDASQEAAGITCASCHLTPDGRIRGPYDLPSAPHATVQDPGMQSSAACALCHSMGPRVVGKQTQTFLEWREDFNKPG